MAIEFPCSGCGKAMRAPDGSTGRQARCPLCGATQAIPAFNEDEDVFPSIGPDEIAPVPSPPPSPESPVSAAGELGAAIVPPPPGTSMPSQCLKAITYGLSNFRSTFLMALMAAGLHLMFSIIASFAFCAGAIITAFADLVIGGFFLRFYLDAVISSLEGVNMAPDLPEVNLRAMFLNGLKGLGILFVYICPVVTIPFLPLGLLGLAYSDDIRTFDLTWVAKAAMKKPGQLLILWPILLLWIVAMVAACLLLFMLLGLAIAAVAGTGCLGWLVSLLIGVAGVGVIAGVGVMFITVLFRCVGMLGRYNPELLEMIPERPETTKSIAFILAGILISAGMLYFVIFPALRGLSEATPR